MYTRKLRTLALAAGLCAPALLVSGCKDEIASPPRASADMTVGPEGRQPRAVDRFPQLAQAVNEVRIDLSRHQLPPPLDDNALVDSVRKVGGVVMIGFKPSGSPPTRETGVFHAMAQSVALAARHAVEARGATLLRTMRSSSMIVARIPAELAPELRRLPYVNYLEPDGIMSVAQAPLVPQDTGWGVRKVRADWVWSNLNISGTGVVITILDTGIDSVHFYGDERDGPENIFAGCYYMSGVATTCFQGPNAINVHGSHVAGIISARNNAYGVDVTPPFLSK